MPEPVWTKKQCSHSTNVGTEVLGYASGIYNLFVHGYLPALFMWIKTKLRSTQGQESSREFEMMIPDHTTRLHCVRKTDAS